MHVKVTNKITLEIVGNSPKISVICQHILCGDTNTDWRNVYYGEQTYSSGQLLGRESAT